MKSFAIFLHRLAFHKITIMIGTLILGLLSYGALYFLFFKHLELIKLEDIRGEGLNNFGTAAAGIIGTGITILGAAFLVYAYKDQQRQAESELFNKLYEDLLNDINSIQYRKIYNSKLSSPDDSELFQGVDALFNYAGDDKAESSVLNHLHLIVVSFKHIADLVSNSKYYTPKSKNIMLDKIYLLYLSKIYWPCNKISNVYRQKIIKSHWGYARSLFYHLDMMIKKAYFHLDGRGLIFGPSKKTLKQVLAEGQAAETGEILLVPELRLILQCNYETAEEYWKAPPELPISNPVLYKALPDSKLNNIITCILGESAFSDAIIDELNKGKFLEARHKFVEARDFISWLKTAPFKPSKYPSKNKYSSKKRNDNPRGCWEARDSE